MFLAKRVHCHPAFLNTTMLYHVEHGGQSNRHIGPTSFNIVEFKLVKRVWLMLHYVFELCWLVFPASCV